MSNGDDAKPDWLDDELRRSLRSSMPTDDPAAPAFERVFANAEAEVRRQRQRRWAGTGLAAVAAAVVVGILLRPTAPVDEFSIQESLMTGTQWQAPSDALLPSHPFDIYQETRWTVPDWPSSTIFEEGTLL